MDFLEQPRWITSSGNTIDIGTPGPENSVLIGRGSETNPTWEQSTQGGEILQNVGGNQVTWVQPIITELNGWSTRGASIYAPSSSGNVGEVLVSNAASGEPFWRAPLIRALNGNAWSFGNNNYSIYAPTEAGLEGQIPVSWGNNGELVMKTLPLQYFGRDTSSATSFTKTVAIDGFPDAYVDGLCVTIYFKNDLSSLVNTNYPGIRINDLPEKTVYDKYGNHVNKNAIYQWAAGSYVTFVYNASQNRFIAISGMKGSFVFGTTAGGGDFGDVDGNKLFTIYGLENQQYGRISVYASAGPGLPADIAYVTGEYGYWGKQYLCATAFIPDGYKPGIYVEHMQTMNYSIKYLDY